MASSKQSIASSVLLTIFIVCVISVNSIAEAHKLSKDYYSKTCPDLHKTVRKLVRDIVANEPRMGASLLRMHFHDCFVNGCDASVLLDVEGGEKESVHNIGSLRGFEVIDTIKEKVEYLCPHVVSCTDILALVARESVVALGGPSWPMLFGRKDSTTAASAESADVQLPFGNDNVANLVSLFMSKGFSTKEMVALSGAHTIGQARCVRFRNRIYGGQDIAEAFAQAMQQVCPATAGVGDDNLGPLDFATPETFNNDYYKGLTNFEGLLESDQTLFTGGQTQTNNIVRLYAKSEHKFFSSFSAAMLKMSKMDVKTGNDGIIRCNCRTAAIY